MVNSGHDLIVIGGYSARFERDAGYSNNLFKLSCNNNVCKWEILSQKMEIPRYWLVAISVPNDFITCCQNKEQAIQTSQLRKLKHSTAITSAEETVITNTTSYMQSKLFYCMIYFPN